MSFGGLASTTVKEIIYRVWQKQQCGVMSEWEVRDFWVGGRYVLEYAFSMFRMPFMFKNKHFLFPDAFYVVK